MSTYIQLLTLWDPTQDKDKKTVFSKLYEKFPKEKLFNKN